ncbi:MAG TPA: lactate utilization protein C [Aliidongia sp.]|nr:lactate utilization protein C [Aliidongia sp.]
MSARDQILGGIRKSLKREALGPDRAAALEARLTGRQRNIIPARTTVLDDAGRVELFVRMAGEVQTSFSRVATPAEVPGAVADYLAQNNLPAEIAMAPDPALDAYPWQERPLLSIRRGKAEDKDPVSVTPAFAGIAETGTLMLVSGPDTPTTLNLMPDTHIVVMREDQIVGPYEEAWDRLRARQGDKPLPRTVNFITGPSRTGDIEQRIELGAHGPRRLHIVLIEEPKTQS